MIIVILILLGLVFGSFVNAFVWRLRQQELASELPSEDDRTAATVISTEGDAVVEKSPKKRKTLIDVTQGNGAEDYSIVHGRSMCPDCRHTLAAKDLVPVVSWVMLRGKCRYCHKPISWQYPLVELLTALFFAASYLLWPLDFDAYGIFRLIVWLIFVVFFMALSVYDFRWFELPDRVVWPLVVLAAGQVLVSALWQEDSAVIWQSALAGATIFGLFWVIYQVSKGEWIGGGDVKLGLVLGLLAGTPLNALLVIFFASVIGTVFSIPILLDKKGTLKMHVPFGPALILGLVVVLLFGNFMVTWYQGIMY